MIELKDIMIRRENLIEQLTTFQTQLVTAKEQVEALTTNINVISGAIQQCEYFAALLNDPGEESVEEEKEDE